MFLMIVSNAGYILWNVDLVTKKLDKLRKVDKDIKIEQQKLNSAKVLNEELKEVSKVILNSITREKSFETEEINAFVKKLADLADKNHILINAISPKPVSNLTSFIEQSYILELNCEYLQLGRFMTELESFDNIMKVKTLDVKPTGDNKDQDPTVATRYRVTLELSTFKILKEA
jgi:Tfp pilus assembly protein PilO